MARAIFIVSLSAFIIFCATSYAKAADLAGCIASRMVDTRAERYMLSDILDNYQARGFFTEDEEQVWGSYTLRALSQCNEGEYKRLMNHFERYGEQADIPPGIDAHIVEAGRLVGIWYANGGLQ